MEFGPGVLSSVGVAAGAGVGLNRVGDCGVAAGNIGGMGDCPTAEASTSGIGGALSCVGVAGANVLPPAGIAAGVGLNRVGDCGVAAGNIGGMGDWPTAEASTSGI